MSERKQISNGYGWFRYLLIPVVLILLSDVIYGNEYWYIELPFLVLTIAAYYWLSRSRKIKYDEKNLYLIYGKKEKVIPFQDIISIKRSRSKVNGSRYWILKYQSDKVRTVRYFRDYFNKEFHSAVRTINPNVVIWTHPFFNH